MNSSPFLALCLVFISRVHVGHAVGCKILQLDGTLTDTCRNGASCEPIGTDGHRCTCLSGYHGDECEKETNECLSNPCRNSATCVDLLNGYRCDCPSGFTGVTCSEIVSTACQNSPCQNGGICTPTGTITYVCSCPSGYSGNNCEIAPHPCFNSPCQNGGTCNVVGSTYTCSCHSFYSGSNCQLRSDTACPVANKTLEVINMCAAEMGAYVEGEFYMITKSDSQTARQCTCYVYGFDFKYRVYSSNQLQCNTRLDITSWTFPTSSYGCQDVPPQDFDAKHYISLDFVKQTAGQNNYCIHIKPEHTDNRATDTPPEVMFQCWEN